MDVTDIGKVASRKRMNTDAEKLREKVSRETAKIIKLKVAQDTAYWDLKERLQQLQGAHERLQQNMVDVQMQHEAASAHYTQELRLRPDTLNKLAGARGVCDVLEQYGSRLRRCVARGRADGAALQAAYAACGARVRRLAGELTRVRDRAAALRDAARESHSRETVASQQLAEARDQLGAARAAANERAVRLHQADEAAAAMRDELARLLQQLDAQAQHMQQSVARREDETRAARQESASRAQEAATLAAELRATQALLADAQNAIDLMKQTEAAHVKEINNLEKVVNDKNQHEKEMDAEISRIKECVKQLETKNLEVKEQLNKSEQACSELRTALSELSTDAEQLRASLAAERQAKQAQQDADAKLLDELRAAAAAKDRELDAKTGTIARLMTDLKNESDARARTDTALAAARRQHDADVQAARAREQQLRDNTARLEMVVKAKDDELGAQMTIILDMRGEKERLQERIQGMQNTIDNIQKELTGRLGAIRCAVADGETPELDAGPLSPRKPDPHSPRKPEPHSPRKPELRKPEPRPTELYSFLSDGSVDGDALDPREVGRRFEALSRGHMRGERLRTSQVKDDLKMKSRTFFKNKRFDTKPKKLK